MAREGYRIFDADTHIIEPAEPIEEYLSASDRAKLTEPLVQRPPGRGGKSRYRVGKRPELNRRLGSRERVPPAAAVTRGLKDGGTPWDVRWQGPPFPSDRVNFDPHARVTDMDIEGVDANMILPSGGLPAFCGLDDVALELAMYQAYHRFLKDYCAPYPDRLTSVILVSGRDVAASVAEIRRCGREAWPVGVFPICPPEMSLDDPDWEPIWAAAQEHDLTVVIHSFTMTVPYPPGMWDTWDNVFLQRSAGHVWNAQRNMAALIGAGVLDRYPELRLTSLECGHGWLAFWAARLDEHAEMCQHALPPLKRKPSEYIRGPQYFQSIQLHEGERSLRHAIEALG
ncbi:MAG: amidohydrolase family protein, partial [Candidatus Rokuibacteriota bacterium]